MDNTAAATAAYQRALQLDSGHGAAKLRLGHMLGRRGKAGDLAMAPNAFGDAEKIYSASSDYEGITEALWQRANLLNRRSRVKEAMPGIDRAFPSRTRWATGIKKSIYCNYRAGHCKIWATALDPPNWRSMQSTPQLQRRWTTWRPSAWSIWVIRSCPPETSTGPKACFAAPSIPPGAARCGVMKPAGCFPWLRLASWILGPMKG